MSIVSYAQNYEDVMLWRALRAIPDGFYVDVGANDPVIDSVTFLFYQSGWSGINIEPVPYWLERLQSGRPRDINVGVAVSTERGPLTLFEVPGTGLSTLDPHVAAGYKREGMAVIERTVPVATLEHLLEHHAGDRTIHFLKVDVEGAERAVLQSTALARYRPWIILVEATEPRSPTPNEHLWEDLLTTRGYLFAYSDGLNRFYVANEHADLLSALKTPPNTFDSFIRYAEWQLRESVQQLQVQVDQAKRARDRVVEEQSMKEDAHEALLQEHQALIQRYAQLRQSQEDLEAGFQVFRQRYSDLEQSQKAISLNYQALLQAHAALNKIHFEQGGAHQKMVHNHTELRRQHESLKQEHQRVNQQIAQLSQFNQQLQEIHRQNGQENASLRRRVQDMTQSTSWRITGPLRQIGALLKQQPHDHALRELALDGELRSDPAPLPMPTPEQTVKKAEPVVEDDLAKIHPSTRDDLLLQHIQLHWRLIDRLDETWPEDGETRCALCDFIGPTDAFKAFDTQCQFGGGRLHRIQCPNCDVVFGPRKMLRLNSEELGQEYDWHYRVFKEGDSTEQEVRAFEALNPRREGTYLNYGAGAWSSSVRVLRERGWNVVAYEPTESAQSLPGLVTRRDVLATMRFDGIFSNNVLEHLRYPVQDLRFLAGLLHPGGRMSHATPCFEYLYEYTRFHLFFYLGRSREFLAASSGLRICSFLQDGHFMNAVYEPIDPCTA